jgi:hypothetical protein
MPAKRWEELSVDEKADALRQTFDAFDERERQNIQERAYRVGKIERRLDAMEEALKQIQSRLDCVEGTNQS